MVNVSARRLWGIAAASLLVVAASMVAPASAQARAANPVHRAYSVTATSGGTVVGRGFFQGFVNQPGNVMELHSCDLYADGMRTVVWVYGSGRSFKVSDTNGAMNSCGIIRNVPHVIVGTLEICRQDGSAGTPLNCARTSFDYSAFWEA